MTDAERLHARYWQRKLGGKCVRCGCGLLPEWDSRCPECLAEAKRSDRRYAATRKGRRTRRDNRRRYVETHREMVRSSRIKRWHERQLAGQCQSCKEPSVDGDYCAVHTEIRRLIAIRSTAGAYRARLDAGMCVRCGKCEPRPDRRECVACAKKVAEWKRRRGETLGGRSKSA